MILSTNNDDNTTQEKIDSDILCVCVCRGMMCDMPGGYARLIEKGLSDSTKCVCVL